MLELLSTDEEDSTELDDATELLLFAEELLATDEEDFAELDDATELLDPSTSLGMTLEEGGSSTLEDDSTELEETAELEVLAIEEELFTLEELTTDEEDSTELEETTEQELTTELLDCFASLAMTLEEELPGSSVGDEVVKIEEDDTSAGFSSPDEPFAEVLSSQAARPKASANATLVKKFFFIFHFPFPCKNFRYPSRTASVIMQIYPSGSS